MRYRSLIRHFNHPDDSGRALDCRLWLAVMANFLAFMALAFATWLTLTLIVFAFHVLGFIAPSTGASAPDVHSREAIASTRPARPTTGIGPHNSVRFVLFSRDSRDTGARHGW